MIGLMLKGLSAAGSNRVERSIQGQYIPKGLRSIGKGLPHGYETVAGRISDAVRLADDRATVWITERTALNIVSFRNENGSFRSRLQVLKVPGIVPKSFEQAAGFLRIRNGDNPLDMTAVHPESYPVVEQIAESLETSVDAIIHQPALLERVDRSRLSAGSYTLDDILAELRKPAATRATSSWRRSFTTRSGPSKMCRLEWCSKAWLRT